MLVWVVVHLCTCVCVYACMSRRWKEETLHHLMQHGRKDKSYATPPAPPSVNIDLVWTCLGAHLNLSSACDKSMHNPANIKTRGCKGRLLVCRLAFTSYLKRCKVSSFNINQETISLRSAVMEACACVGMCGSACVCEYVYVCVCIPEPMYVSA